MPESGIFSGCALSAAYTSASTAWSVPCQEARPWLPADVCRLTRIVVEAIAFLFCPRIYRKV